MLFLAEVGPLGGNRVGGGSFNRIEITRGFQSHHIISNKNSLHTNHSVLRSAGFDLNSRPNRMYLPVHPDQHSTRSLHNGRHTNVAMNGMTRKLDALEKIGKAENWNQSQYRSALREMLAEERQELRKGNIALNSKCRPWAK